MLIVRTNKSQKNPLVEKAFKVYLRLPDGSDHEIHGVTMIKRDATISYELYTQYTVEFVVDDQAVRYE